MARSPTPQGTLRQRNVSSKENDGTSTPPLAAREVAEKPVAVKGKARKEQYRSKPERGHQLALTLVTILAFVTRFWGISHPDEVVFDEVHFGKVGHGYINGEGEEGIGKKNNKMGENEITRKITIRKIKKKRRIIKRGAEGRPVVDCGHWEAYLY